MLDVEVDFSVVEGMGTGILDVVIVFWFCAWFKIGRFGCVMVREVFCEVQEGFIYVYGGVT